MGFYESVRNGNKGVVNLLKCKTAAEDCGAHVHTPVIPALGGWGKRISLKEESATLSLKK